MCTCKLCFQTKCWRGSSYCPSGLSTCLFRQTGTCTPLKAKVRCMFTWGGWYSRLLVHVHEARETSLAQSKLLQPNHEDKTTSKAWDTPNWGNDFMNAHQKNVSQCFPPPPTVRFRIFTVMSDFDDTKRRNPLIIEIVVLYSL